MHLGFHIPSPKEHQTPGMEKFHQNKGSFEVEEFRGKMNLDFSKTSHRVE